MKTWEEEWMQFIDGLDQKEANRRMLRSHGHFSSNTAAAAAASSRPLPEDVYSFECALSVEDLASEQSQVLLLSPSFSCSLLTTLYLYSTQFCLLGLFLLLLASLALLTLCLLLCLYPYHQCFDLKTTRGGGRKKVGSGSDHSAASSDGCFHCKGQRDIIIQVNQALPTQQQPQQPQQPPAPVPLPPPKSPPKSPLKSSPPEPPPSIPQPKSEIDQHLGAEDQSKEPQPVADENGHQPQPAETVEEESAAAEPDKSVPQNSIEVLAMHLATHLSSVQSFLESSNRRARHHGQQKKKKKRSKSSSQQGSSSSRGSGSLLSTGSTSSRSIYLSDLPAPLSSLDGNSSSTDGSNSKERKRKNQQRRKRRSILCFPLSTNQSTVPALLSTTTTNEPLGVPSSSKDDYQTADEEEEAELAALLILNPGPQQQQAPPVVPSIPLPSAQVPPCMVLNRYAKKLLPPEEGEGEEQQQEEEEAPSSSESP